MIRAWFRQLLFGLVGLVLIGAGMALLMVYAVVSGCCACVTGAGLLVWAAGL